MGIENEANYGLQIIVGKKKEKGEELAPPVSVIRESERELSVRISFRYLPVFCSEGIEVVISILSAKHQFPSFFDTNPPQFLTRCLLIFKDMLICMQGKEALDNFVNDFFERRIEIMFLE